MGYAGNQSVITFPDSLNGSDYKIYDYAFYYCTSLESITIPEGVTSIGYRVFYDSSSLKRVTISASVISIEDEAFSGCRFLESITISDGVASIGFNAFGGCSSLKVVYYGGTESDWGNMDIGSYNAYLTDATRYYYSENQPTEEGNFWHFGTDGVTPVIWLKETT